MKKIIALILSMIFMLSFVACAKQPLTEGTAQNANAVKAEGKGKGFKGDIVLEAEFADNKVTNVTVKEIHETEGIGDVAIEKLTEEVVKTGSIAVDSVSGATYSSEGFVLALKDAIKNAGLNEADFMRKSEDNSTSEAQEIETDVVIIGAGVAGMTAAIEAKDAGKSVVILEKSSFTGGNTTRATGGMNAAKTEFQDKNTFEANEKEAVLKRVAEAKEKYPELKELAETIEKQLAEYEANPKGYFDSKELFKLDTLVGGKNLNNHELVDKFVEESEPAIQWLKTLGMELTDVAAFGGASVKRIHRPLVDGKTKGVGSYLVPKLTEILEQKEIAIMFDTAAEELIVENDAVVGVKAGNVTVKAKSVVITTGGFGANLDKVVEIKPDLKGFVSTNAPQMTGDGIWMAQKVGAAVVDLDQIQIHPTVEQETASLITEGVRGDGAILVNQEGKRFVNEVDTRDKVSAAEVAQEGGFAYLIVDSRMVEKSGPLQGYIEKGFTTEGKTVEELAKALNINEANLVATMDSWNKAVEAKSDAEFERQSFADKLDQAPFYAIKVAPGIHHTMGGLKINTDAQVLKEDGTAIKNLYAAGEVTGGVHGANRLGGNAVADIIIFGRIAGQNAANNAK